MTKSDWMKMGPVDKLDYLTNHKKISKRKMRLYGAMVTEWLMRNGAGGSDLLACIDQARRWADGEVSTPINNAYWVLTKSEHTSAIAAAMYDSQGQMLDYIVGRVWDE